MTCHRALAYRPLRGEDLRCGRRDHSAVILFTGEEGIDLIPTGDAPSRALFAEWRGGDGDESARWCTQSWVNKAEDCFESTLAADPAQHLDRVLVLGVELERLLVVRDRPFHVTGHHVSLA